MKWILAGIFILTLSNSPLAQKEQDSILVDGLSHATNDDLLARVDNLRSQLRDDSTGVVILSGSTLTNYLNKRRIEGCNLMRRYPAAKLIFVFGIGSQDYEFEFWKLSKGVPLGSRFSPTELDYNLPELKLPVELTTSTSTDEYCPRHFDLQWYSKFLKGNPTFKGKAVFDTSKRDFLTRVTKYRKQLQVLGIDPNRVRFLRHHFYHERDEQWWPIPPRK